jgi:hypothetical protein
MTLSLRRFCGTTMVCMMGFSFSVTPLPSGSSSNWSLLASSGDLSSTAALGLSAGLTRRRVLTTRRSDSLYRGGSGGNRPAQIAPLSSLKLLPRNGGRRAASSRGAHTINTQIMEVLSVRRVVLYRRSCTPPPTCRWLHCRDGYSRSLVTCSTTVCQL